ncbi:nitroreductase/quinone reductase family protein [Georgenia yuyongxinii]|nr:nitroreductase/quinone reductase family protein [Georgenia yuyongxinii]
MHRAFLVVTGGRIGWQVAGMPVVELTTTGRRTGRPHRVLLTSPVQDGSTLVVVASRGGDDRPPEWLLNIRSNPAVRVRTRRGRARPMRARVAGTDEHTALWPRVTGEHPTYGTYQARTSRQIALVLLEQGPGRP